MFLIGGGFNPDSKRLTPESIAELKACDSYSISRESTGYTFAYGYKNDRLEVLIHANSEDEIRMAMMSPKERMEAAKKKRKGKLAKRIAENSKGKNLTERQLEKMKIRLEQELEDELEVEMLMSGMSNDYPDY